MIFLNEVENVIFTSLVSVITVGTVTATSKFYFYIFTHADITRKPLIAFFSTRVQYKFINMRLYVDGWGGNKILTIKTEQSKKQEKNFLPKYCKKMFSFYYSQYILALPLPLWKIGTDFFSRKYFTFNLIMISSRKKVIVIIVAVII